MGNCLNIWITLACGETKNEIFRMLDVNQGIFYLLVTIRPLLLDSRH